MIHESISSRGAGFVRAWTFTLWAVYLLGHTNPQAFAQVPDLEFEPPGILGVLPDWFYDLVLTPTGLSLLKWTLLAGVIACAVGVRPWRAIAIPTVLLLTLHQGISRGLFDYVNHKELGALYATYIIAAFPATGFSLFTPRTAKALPDHDSALDSEQEVATRRMMMLLLTVVFLIPYTLVGLYRLAHNDMSIWNGDTFANHIARTSYGTNWFGNTAISEAVITRPLLLKLLAISFPIGTILEVLAPLCIVHKRFRQLWAPSMVGLHLLTWATLDILFWENLALYPILLVDGEYLLRKFDRLRGRNEPTRNETPSIVRQKGLAGRPVS